jgi:hypothetical protein
MATENLDGVISLAWTLGELSRFPRLGLPLAFRFV